MGRPAPTHMATVVARLSIGLITLIRARRADSILRRFGRQLVLELGARVAAGIVDHGHHLFTLKPNLKSLRQLTVLVLQY
jgi:hypothetical protein